MSWSRNGRDVSFAARVDTDQAADHLLLGYLTDLEPGREQEWGFITKTAFKIECPLSVTSTLRLLRCATA